LATTINIEYQGYENEKEVFDNHIDNTGFADFVFQHPFPYQTALLEE
jgi:hypothetical protein